MRVISQRTESGVTCNVAGRRFFDSEVEAAASHAASVGARTVTIRREVVERVTIDLEGAQPGKALMLGLRAARE